MKYQDSYLESCWKKTLGKFASGKKRAVLEKIINLLVGRSKEDPTSNLEGRKLERNLRFLSMKEGGEI